MAEGRVWKTTDEMAKRQTEHAQKAVYAVLKLKEYLKGKVVPAHKHYTRRCMGE
jgi:hypothetical protein